MWVGAVLFFVAGAGSSVYLSDVAENDWSRPVRAVAVTTASDDAFERLAAAVRDAAKLSWTLASILHNASYMLVKKANLATLACVEVKYALRGVA